MNILFHPFLQIFIVYELLNIEHFHWYDITAHLILDFHFLLLNDNEHFPMCLFVVYIFFGSVSIQLSIYFSLVCYIFCFIYLSFKNLIPKITQSQISWFFSQHFFFLPILYFYVQRSSFNSLGVCGPCLPMLRAYS